MSPEQERFGFLKQKQFLRSSLNHCGIAKFSFNCMRFNFSFDCGTKSSEVNSKQPLPGIRCYENSAFLSIGTFCLKAEPS